MRRLHATLPRKTGLPSRQNLLLFSQDQTVKSPATGTITLVVFREKTVREEPPLLDDEAEDLVALSRGVLPQERPQTLAALKFQLREGSGQGRSRGMIVEGQRLGAAVRTVEFQPDPTPVMSATITYYRP
jgi:hypothetical protein